MFKFYFFGGRFLQSLKINLFSVIEKLFKHQIVEAQSNKLKVQNFTLNHEINDQIHNKLTKINIVIIILLLFHIQKYF